MPRPNVYVCIGLLLLMASAATALIGHWSQYHHFSARQLFLDLYSNISTGFFEIAITVLLVDSITRRRASQEEKMNLILQAGSPNNAQSVEAVRQLRARNWIATALGKAHLSDANLEKADLHEVNFKQAELIRANLSHANLFGANLEGAVLIEAKLIRADLPKAILRSANLFKADLSGAILGGADLRGANLKGARLDSAMMDGVKLDSSTTLPDGSRWTRARSLDTFTNG
jgi:hypothetical protein